jgi:hypothetical protein
MVPDFKIMGFTSTSEYNLLAVWGLSLEIYTNPNKSDNNGFPFIILIKRPILNIFATGVFYA